MLVTDFQDERKRKLLKNKMKEKAYMPLSGTSKEHERRRSEKN
jgi:hypothetical protein